MPWSLSDGITAAFASCSISWRRCPFHISNHCRIQVRVRRRLRGGMSSFSGSSSAPAARRIRPGTKSWWMKSSVTLTNSTRSENPAFTNSEQRAEAPNLNGSGICGGQPWVPGLGAATARTVLGGIAHHRGRFGASWGCVGRQHFADRRPQWPGY